MKITTNIGFKIELFGLIDSIEILASTVIPIYLLLIPTCNAVRYEKHYAAKYRFNSFSTEKNYLIL